MGARKHEPVVVIKSEERRLVYAEVYSPMRVDTDVEAMTADEIEKMAHAFLANGLTDKVDVQHDYEESGAVIVESFIARKNDPDGFVTGSWVVGAHIGPDDLWKAVKKGELNGFSFAAEVGRTEPVLVKVKAARRIVGETEENTDGVYPVHVHEIDLQMSPEGNIVPGLTKVAKGHVHPVAQATATKEELEHSHRLILIENEEDD